MNRKLVYKNNQLVYFLKKNKHCVTYTMKIGYNHQGSLEKEPISCLE